MAICSGIGALVFPAGTGGLTVPMYIALRRFTLLITLGLEKYAYGKKHNTVTHGTDCHSFGRDMALSNACVVMQ